MAAHETKSTFSVNKDTFGASRNNFNGTTDSFFEGAADPFSSSAANIRSSITMMNKEHGQRGRLLASTLSGPMALQAGGGHIVASPSTRVATIQRTSDVYCPGETPTVPAIKRRHELHRVDENVGLLPVTETQLRQKFSELDRNNDGYLDLEEFTRVYSSYQLVGLEDQDKHLRPLVQKYGKDGKIYFEGFSILMLRLVNM